MKNKYVFAVFLIGLPIIAFDLLRKTIFRTASWNYHYPDHRYMISPIALILLVLVFAIAITLVHWLLDLSGEKFAISVYLLTFAVGGLVFLSLPVTSQSMALSPETTKTSHDFLYHPTVVLVKSGPLEFFRTFHTIPTLSGADRKESARVISQLINNYKFVPFHEPVARYIGEIVTGRHGPIPSLLIAPFLVVFGPTPTSAVFGVYLLVSLTPVIGYFTFRLYFPDHESRIGSLLILGTPALFIWLRHKTIPYDAITGLIIAVTTYFVLRGVRDESGLFIGLGGITFSLAALSKISILPLFAPFILIIFVSTEEYRRHLIRFFGAFMVVPLGLLPLGYNFIAWYIFDIGSIFIDSSGGYGPANNYLSNPLLRIGSTWYNIRLVGIYFLICSLGVIANIRAILKSPITLNLIGLSFTIAVIPFLFLFGMTISRHLLGILIPIVFFTLIAVEYADLGVSFVRASMAINALILLVNL